MDKRKRSDEYRDTLSKKRHMTTTTNKEPNESSTSAAVNVNDIEDVEDLGRSTFDVRTLIWEEDIDFPNTDSSCLYPESMSSLNSEHFTTSMLSETNGRSDMLAAIKGNTEDRHTWKKNLFCGHVLTSDSLDSGTDSSRCSSSSTCLSSNVHPEIDVNQGRSVVGDKIELVTTNRNEFLSIADLDKITRITTEEKRLKVMNWLKSVEMFRV